MHFKQHINLLKSAVQRMETTQIAIKQEMGKNAGNSATEIDGSKHIT